MRSLLVGIIATLIPISLFAQDIKFLQFDNFQFESGATVPNVKLAYQVRGALNADKSNAILLPSHYGADHTGYDYLIGPGRELDPTKYSLILTNMFANGVSSSPSNTPDPFHGPKFPRVSIRDNVEAQLRLVRDELGITKLKAIVGFSMGGQQAYQWAVSHPDMTDRVVVICSDAKQYPFGIIRLQGSISALKADDDFKDGNYTSPPEKGLRAFGMHYRAWTRSAAAWDRNMFDSLSNDELESQLNTLSEAFLTFDANNLISQAETWKRHNVADTPSFNGNLETALRSIRAKVLLMPSTSDQYFLLADSAFEATMLNDVSLQPIQTIFGHTGGGGTDPVATDFIDNTIRDFLNNGTAPKSTVNAGASAFRDLEKSTAMMVPSANGQLFLISTSRGDQHKIVAIPVDTADGPETAGSAFLPGGRSAEEDDSPVLVDVSGGRHSLREFAGRSRVIVLIQGMYCEHCMAQLAGLMKGLSSTECSVIVLTSTNDIPTLSNSSFSVFADPDNFYFRKFGAFRNGPLHGTVVINQRDEVVFKHVGETPLTDISVLKSALTKGSASSGRRVDAL